MAVSTRFQRARRPTGYGLRLSAESGKHMRAMIGASGTRYLGTAVNTGQRGQIAGWVHCRREAADGAGGAGKVGRREPRMRSH